MAYETELTKPHRLLVSKLQAEGYTVYSEVPFGTKKVDIYLPDYHVAIEVDGPTHGRGADMKRDVYLFDEFGLQVLHIKTNDVTKSDVLDKVLLFTAEHMLTFDTRVKLKRGKW